MVKPQQQLIHARGVGVQVEKVILELDLTLRLSCVVEEQAQQLPDHGVAKAEGGSGKGVVNGSVNAGGIG